jgi:hypothetical protein
MLNYHNFKTIEQAFAYIVDCNLATVSDMAMKKSRPKFEYLRRISIAQKMCDAMVDFEIPYQGTRAEKIIGKMTVSEWASKYEPKQVTKSKP